MSTLSTHDHSHGPIRDGGDRPDPTPSHGQMSQMSQAGIPSGMTVGQRLRRLRRQHHLTVEDLADQLQYALDTVSQIDRGSRDPSLQFCRQLAHLYGISLSELFAGVDLPEITDLPD